MLLRTLLMRGLFEFFLEKRINGLSSRFRISALESPRKIRGTFLTVSFILRRRSSIPLRSLMILVQAGRVSTSFG